MRRLRKMGAGIMAMVMMLSAMPAIPSMASESGDVQVFYAQEGQSVTLPCDEVFGATTIETSIKTTVNDWEWMLTTDTEVTVTDGDALDGINAQYSVYLGEYDLTDVTEIVFEVSGSTCKGTLYSDLSVDDVGMTEAGGAILTEAGFTLYNGGAWDYNVDFSEAEEGSGALTLGTVNTSSIGTISVSEEVTGIKKLYYIQNSPSKGTFTCGLTSVTFVSEQTVSDYSGYTISSVSKDGASLDANGLGMCISEGTFSWDTYGNEISAGTYTIMFSAVTSAGVAVEKTVNIVVKEAPDTADVIEATSSGGTIEVTSQIGQPVNVTSGEVFGMATQKLGITSDVNGWKWMLTTATAGSVADENGVTGLNDRYLIYLGDYDLTNVSEVILTLNANVQIKGNLFIDYGNVDVSGATINESMSNDTDSFKVYQAGPWDCGCDGDGTNITPGDFTINGTSTEGELKNYSCTVNTAESGVHSLYLRVYKPDNSWPGDLAYVTLVKGEDQVVGGTISEIVSVTKGDESLTQEAWTSLGMTVSDGAFSWDTSAMENAQAGTYSVQFNDGAKATITIVGNEDDEAEVIEKPILEAISTKKGQNVNLSKGEIFGQTTKVIGLTTDASNWQWMSTLSSSGEVTSDGSLEGLNARYLVYMGQYNLSGVTDFILNMRLNSEIEKFGCNFFADYGNVDVGAAETNGNVSVDEDVANFSIYTGDSWSFGADGDGVALTKTINFDPTTGNNEFKDYSCELNNPQEGVHSLYFRTFLPEKSWPGDLASITLVTGENTIYGANDIAISSVTRNGNAVSQDEWEALGMTISDEEGFVWRTLYMDNAKVGEYVITFLGEDASGNEVFNSVTVTVEGSARSYKHPGILYTTEQINNMYEKYQSGKEPWKSAGDELLEAAKAEYELEGLESVINAGNIVWTDTSSVVNGKGFNNAFRADCQIVYQNTLAYLLTKDSRYAEVAIDILNQYSELKPSIDGHDKVFVASQMAFRLCNAAELLRYSYVDENGNSIWREDDILKFQEWMMDEFVPIIDEYGMANGGISILKGMLAVGIFCENDACYDFAINGFMYDENCSVTGAINEFGQNRESGRDQIHSQLIIGHFAEIAWSVYNQQPELKFFEYGNHRILKGYEYMLKYMMGEEVEYDSSFYSTNYTYSNVISENGRGLLLPIYEFVYNYYVGVLGWSEDLLPYTSQAVVYTRNEGVACYNGSYDTYHMIGYGTLNTTVLECPAQVSDASVSVTAQTGGTALVSWGAAEGATGYNVYRSNQEVTDTDPTLYPMAWYSKVNDTPIAELSCLDAGLVAGEDYFYKITAVNSNGQESGCSEPIYVTALEEAPTVAPASVEAVTVSDNISKINWTAVSGAAGYNIYVAADDGEYTKLNDEVVTDTNCYHLGLQSGVTYRYKVQAYNSYGVSEISEAYAEKKASVNATGTGMGAIGKYPAKVVMKVSADVSVDTSDTFTANEASNYCANSAAVSYMKFDLSDLTLYSGDEIESARLYVYRSGSTSPIAVHKVESDAVDYDDWGETLSEDGVTANSFTQGNLKFAIEEEALTVVESNAAKPSGNSSYNSADGAGIDLTEAVRQEVAGDKVLTLRVSAIGTGGSNAMSFHSLHAGNEYVPHVVITIKNSIIDAYENPVKPQAPGNSGSGSSGHDDTTDDLVQSDAVSKENAVKNPLASGKTEENIALEGQKPTVMLQVVDKDWADVKDAIQNGMAEAGDGDVLFRINLSEHFELPTQITDTIRGENVTLQLHLDNGIIWEINGSDVDNVRPVNMKVEYVTDAVPAEQLAVFENFGEARQISLEHDGEFGFKATMKYPVTSEDEGKFANLFYYHDGTLEFVTSSRVVEGYAELAFEHASDYVVVITEIALTEVPKVENQETVVAPDMVEESELTTVTEEAKGGNSFDYFLLVVALIVVVAVAVAVAVLRTKKKSEAAK